jgi:hypothetical protein
MASTLTVMSGPIPGLVFELSETEVNTVGRGTGCTIVLKNDSKVSRSHAAIGRTKDRFAVVDMNSANGCFVNGQRVKKAFLEDGDAVLIGQYMMRFFLDREAMARYAVESPNACLACRREITPDEIHTGLYAKSGTGYYCLRCIDETNIIGCTLGGFHILEELGKGSVGRVYRARQLSEDRTVALKIVHRELVAQPKVMKMFVREARAGRGVQHPNVVCIYDVGNLYKIFFLAMEYVDGESLIRILNREGPCSMEKAADIGGQICSGLAYLHSRGIIHRDVKPENVLINKVGEAKLADLGLAKNVGGSASGSSTLGGKMLGTPSYMSPEQIRDARKVDFRTDVYAFGATLYRMVTGKPPFAKGPPLEVAKQVLTEEPEPAEKVNLMLDPEIAQIIKKAMKKDPNMRFQSFEEILALLRGGEVARS